ncbi:hypothetical protein CBR_g26261 [Chara braunii]|uniref:Nucleolar protein 11 C-terminal domain-containing protein n=1 Tax=Chara braunii TaxID=69332 RepID=A0A388L7F9_CHABU|nr:hypothetical protein CBR_g26261 [Chara braunii]|eukprot:GBG78227.1 hypothetical protein CBR_g26261 [Chara braunii]
MDANGFCLCRAASTVGVSREQTGAIVGSTSGTDPSEVVVTVQGDGVVTYNRRTQARTQSWPLGSGNVRFLLPAACDQKSGYFYAVVQAAKGASLENFLLSWTRSGSEKEGVAGTSFSLWGATKKVPLPQKELHSLHPFSGVTGTSSQSPNEAKSEGREGKSGDSQAATRPGTAVIFRDGTIALYGCDGEALCDSDALPAASGRTVEAVASVRTTSGKGKLESQKVAEILWLAVITTETTVMPNEASEADSSARVDSLRKRVTQSVLRLFAVRNRISTSGEDLVINQLHSSVLQPLSRSSLDDSGRSITILTAGFNDADTLSVLWSDGTFDVFHGFSKACSSKTFMRKSFSRKLETFDLEQQQQIHPSTPASLQKSSKKRRAAAVVQEDAQLQGNSPCMGMVAVPRSPYVVFVGFPKQTLSTGSGAHNAAAVSSPRKDGDLARGRDVVVVVVDTLYGCVHVKALVMEANGGENTEKATQARGGVMGTFHGRAMEIGWVGWEDGVVTISSNQFVMVVEVDLPPFSLAMVVGAFAEMSMSSTGTLKGAGARSANHNEVEFASEISSARPAGMWDGLATGVGRVTREVLGEKGVDEIVKPKLKAVPNPVWREEDMKLAQRDGGGDTKSARRGARAKKHSVEGGAPGGVVTRRISGAPWDLEKVSCTDDEERNIIGVVQDESATPSMDVLMDRVSGFLSAAESLEIADLDNGSAAEGLMLEGREESDARLTLRGDLELSLIGNRDAEIEDGYDTESRRKWKRALRRGRRRLLEISPSLVEALVLRSIKSKFWPLLGALIESGLVNGPSVSSTVLSILIESKQPILMSKLVLHTSSLSPASLAQFIKVCLSGGSGESRGWKSLGKAHREAARDFFSKVISKRGNDSGDADEELENGITGAAVRHHVNIARAGAAVMAVDFFSSREQCLHTALACDRDRTILTGALSRLDANEVVALMRYLERWASFYSKTFMQLIPPRSIPGLPVPSMSQVLNWCAVLLDCNFTRLSMLPDCHEVLGRLREVLMRHANFTRKVASLSGVLSHLRNKCYLPTKRALQGQVSAAGYSIEFLQLE